MRTSLIYVYLALAFPIGYDLAAYWFGFRTLSEDVRDINRATSGLVQWGMIALWFHLFIGALTCSNGR
jgi:hypothetical protein